LGEVTQLSELPLQHNLQANAIEHVNPKNAFHLNHYHH